MGDARDQKSYPGVALHPTLPGGRSDCTLRLRRTTLLAHLPSGERLAIELRHARSWPHGKTLAGRAFASDAPGAHVLTTESPELLQRIEALGIVRAPSAKGEAKRTSRLARAPDSRHLSRGQKAVLGSVLGCLTIFALVLLFTGPLAWMLVMLIPTAQDKAIGDQHVAAAIAALSQGSGRLDDPELTANVEPILRRLELPLLPLFNERGWSIRLHVVDSPTVNAFALPGGHILITTALLAFLDSPLELAAVLGHELSHIARRHGMAALVRDEGTAFLFRGTSGMGAVLIAGATHLGGLRYSRSAEIEADTDSIALCAQASIDPRGALGFFARLARLPNADVPPEWTFLASHPMTATRLSMAQRQIDALPRKTFPPFDEVNWKVIDNVLEKLARARTHRRLPQHPWDL